MEKILHVIIMACIIVSLTTGTGIMYIIIKTYRAGKRIMQATLRLPENLNNQRVIEYIELIKNTNIPERRVYSEAVKSGYELIRINEEINEDLKKQLKIIILSKGLFVRDVE
ncbi:hypothetical protein RH915_10270 [Serpentinicella sp. ANB-PHB4]|uniref:hypothetical protein n=1 Tax=Serpentinicella sp. ANB-PHB4 TaxID=3074076 RepID=UPI0028557E89|nr:hypothetical protein [Serpentinicella sp. ANB-PHB4]MDR5659874.1 hypothetical protein [Serpentinicella sp. ANB-PHB4]